MEVHETDLGDNGLSSLHARLEAHFSNLRARRNEHSSDIPIFALEHDLAEDDLARLKSEVCSAVRRAAVPRDSWLPFVIYAAEIGYEYSGDEYWQTFEARTPGWAEYGDRDYIRRKFREFKDRFAGAVPAGIWARHFSIICWPITHAVLPTDLQRHLARLLFEYRRALTSELLAEPAELGRRLAARAWQASSRFQAFAQNTSLLGQVAAALLVGDDEYTPYLLNSTLKRIVADLSKEKESRRWLRDAKSTAIQVRTRGFRPTERALEEKAGAGRQGLLPLTTDPALTLRREAAGWTAYAELPDLSILGERLPNVYVELGRLRARFAGVGGPPLARGRLLYPGQLLRLHKWPEPQTPLIMLEHGSTDVNSLLSEQCVLSPGPRWLFRIRDAAMATEIRGKFVRPGHSYVVLSVSALSIQLPTWIGETDCGTMGVHAYTMDVPSILGPEQHSLIQQVGLGSVVEIEVRPAGLVPALWDGEGTSEWITGENPVIGLSSTREVSQCVITLDSDPQLFPWPTDQSEIFLSLEGLEVGAHDLHVSLIPTEAEQPIGEGSLAVLIRPPQARPSTGSYREGLVILATPMSPTLTELWDGVAGLTVLGPAGAYVDVEVLLADRSNKPLSRLLHATTLPINVDEWRALFEDNFRSVEEIYLSYDQSESCLVTISEPTLGTVSLRCEREFSALRWAAGRDHDGPFVRLIDNTEEGVAKVDLFEFPHPDHRTTPDVVPGKPVRRRDGGLVVAAGTGVRATAILPPEVRDLTDLRRMAVVPQLAVETRSLVDIRKLVGLAELWASSSPPTDPFGANRRSTVLQAITRDLAGLVCGGRWQRLEQRYAADDEHVAESELQDAIGEQHHQRALATDLARYIDQLAALPAESRVRPFAVALATHGRDAQFRREDPRLSEFLLRLASEPASLAMWPPEEFRLNLERTLDSPVILRAARFVVLATQARAAQDQTYMYGGWTWRSG
jgi:hypothetical protein